MLVAMSLGMKVSMFVKGLVGMAGRMVNCAPWVRLSNVKEVGRRGGNWVVYPRPRPSHVLHEQGLSFQAG